MKFALYDGASLVCPRVDFDDSKVADITTKGLSAGKMFCANCGDAGK